MRILCVNYEYPPIGGGGRAACKDLAEKLVRLGHRVDVVTSTLKGLPRMEDTAGVHLERVPCYRRFRHYVTTPEMLTQVIPTYNRARLLMAREDYALNHTHFIVPSGISSYLLWSRTGMPYVITAHGSDVPGYNPDRFSITHRLICPVWRRIIENAAAIVFPSIQENFPVVLLEAMNAGCAVITTSASGCAEVVGSSAIKVPPASVPDLRQAVAQLTASENDIRRLSQAGRHRATQFTSESVARQYESLFEPLALPAHRRVT
jgi:glycosyltransferase involved in cell wall biosynthesis